MASKKVAYWKTANEERLQTFPEDSRQTYLTRPTKYTPKGAVSGGGISVPLAPYCDILEKFGIKAAAMAEHKSSYYISRAKSNVYTLCFFLANKRYRAKFDNLSFAVAPKTFLLIPSRAACDTSADYAKTIWFDIKPTAFWKNVLGNSPICRKAKRLQKLKILAEMYAEEIHSRRPNIANLTSLANLIVDSIKREFAGGAQKPAPIEKLTERIQKNPAEKWTLAKACQYAKVGKYRLNVLFKEYCGTTFSKYLLRTRLECAAETAENSHKTLSEIAREVGFADGHSLNFAYKSFYAVALREHVKHARNSATPKK